MKVTLKARTITAVMLVATLAGCNMAPRYIRPAGAVPAALPEGGTYPEVPVDSREIAGIGWREFFVDERLRSVIALGLENNRDLRVAAANVARLRAQYRVQRADLFPTVDATARATYANSQGLAARSGTGTGAEASGGTTEIYRADIGVSAFEIDLWGKIRNLNEAALQTYFASEEAQKATQISLVAEIATTWLTLAADRDMLAIARDTLESYGRTRELTEAQFRIGTVSELEVRQADTNYQAARNDVAALEAQVAQDRNALDLLAGTPVSDDLLPSGLGEGDATLSDLPAGVDSAVLLQRPDVLEAEHLLMAENANIGAARAALFPTISLTASFGTISSGLSGLFKSGTDAWSVSPEATVPIFNFGRGSANLAAVKAGQKAALATYEKTLQTAFREVADALATRGTIDERLSALSARAESASVAARLSDARYKAGIDSFLTLLDSQRTAYAARMEITNGRLNRAANLVTIYRVFGGGMESGSVPPASK